MKISEDNSVRQDEFGIFVSKVCFQEQKLKVVSYLTLAHWNNSNTLINADNDELQYCIPLVLPSQIH